MGNAASKAQAEYLKNAPTRPLPLKVYDNFDNLNCQHDAQYAPLLQSATNIRDNIFDAVGVPDPKKEACATVMSLSGPWDARVQICTAPSSDANLTAPPPPTLEVVKNALDGIIDGCKDGMTEDGGRLGGTNPVPTSESELKLFVLLDRTNSARYYV
ncbi:MAG: hypothetical protein M1831_003282 [Alyxoria varia]|nr:MAG: hypothetical protein M1831_003282 [Alyxoria varia]